MADENEIKKLNDEINSLKDTVNQLTAKVEGIKKQRSREDHGRKIRYVHKVETTVSQKDSFEEKVNEDIRILSELGAKIVSFQLQNFGISPMTKEMYIIYEMNEGENYVNKETFKKRRKRDSEMQNSTGRGNKKTVEGQRDAD